MRCFVKAAIDIAGPYVVQVKEWQARGSPRDRMERPEVVQAKQWENQSVSLIQGLKYSKTYVGCR